MFKQIKRKSVKSQSWRCFANRNRYIINQGHPHHKLKKVVLAAINFACAWGQTAKDFIKAVHETQDIWKIRKKKSKGTGNPTKDIFFELVYSAPKWLRTRPEERDAIDKIITAPFKNCPIRRGWHLANWDLEEKYRPEKWKPLDDAHYLISARDKFGKATISSRFGHGRETLESWMLRVDEQICDLLNQTREKQYEPVRPIYLRRLEKKVGCKLTKLHEMIAHHTAEPVTQQNLADVIEEMERPLVKNSARMVPVAKVTNKDRTLEEDNLVFVHYTGRKSPNKYRIRKLLLNIANVQRDIELSRPEGYEDHGGGAGGSVDLPSEADSQQNRGQIPSQPEHAGADLPTMPTPNAFTPPLDDASTSATDSKSDKKYDILNPSSEAIRSREKSILIANRKNKKPKKQQKKEPEQEM